MTAMAEMMVKWAHGFIPESYVFDPHEYRFMVSLAHATVMAGRQAADHTRLPAADRDQDKARQRLRRRGYVEFNKHGPANGWRLTNAGIRAMDNHKIVKV